MPAPSTTTAYPGALDTADTFGRATNRAASTLSVGIDATQATFAVPTGEGARFPASGSVVWVENELIAYDTRTGDSFAGCVRGFDGTTAAAHAGGVAVRANITASTTNSLAAAVVAAETKLGSGTGAPAASAFLKGTGAGVSGWSALAGGEVTGALGYTPLSTAGGTLTGRLTLGAGTLLSSVFGSPEPQLVNVLKGTAAAPDTTAAPLLKVSRTQAMTQAALTAANGGADGSDHAPAIVGINYGEVANEVQAVGVLGHARSASTTTAHVGGDDACGVYGVGRITGSGTGTGIGAYFQGRRDTATGRANGVEVASANYTTTAAAYSATGFTDAQGIWLNAVGDSDSAAGLIVANPHGRQFAVGIAFNGQVTGTKTGGVSEASIRDDGNATTSLAVNGSHTYGIDLNGGTFSGQAVRLKNGNTGGLSGRNNAGTADLKLLYLNTSDALILGEGATSLHLAQSFSMQDAKSVVLGSTTGNKIGTAATQKLGFYGATPIVQPANATDLRQALIDLGLLATGGATPLNLNGGTLTVGPIAGNPATIGNGGIWYNSTQAAHRFQSATATANTGAGLVGLLRSQSAVAAGDTIANVAVITNFATNFAIPAAGINVVGKTLRITANGHFSTTGTPTLTFTLRLGTVALAVTAAITTPSGAASLQWRLDAQVTTFATGATGTVDAQGVLSYATATTTGQHVQMRNTATVTADLTLAHTLQLAATWGTAAAANTITMRQFVVEVLD